MDGQSEQTTMQHVEHALPIEVMREFNSFWIMGIVPIILAYIAYRSLKLKVNARNEIRRTRAKKRREENEDTDDEEDETMTDFLLTKIKGDEN